MWYAKQHNLPGLVMQLDFEKAYDSIEWKFMFEVLEKFQVGAYIIEKIKLLYNNIFSTVINDGLTCDWFKLERGVRQGCPLSCFVFIMQDYKKNEIYVDVVERVSIRVDEKVSYSRRNR